MSAIHFLSDARAVRRRRPARAAFADVTHSASRPPVDELTYNFALYSETEPVVLYVGVGDSTFGVELDHATHRTGSVFHAEIALHDLLVTGATCVARIAQQSASAAEHP